MDYHTDMNQHHLKYLFEIHVGSAVWNQWPSEISDFFEIHVGTAVPVITTANYFKFQPPWIQSTVLSEMWLCFLMRLGSIGDASAQQNQRLCSAGPLRSMFAHSAPWSEVLNSLAAEWPESSPTNPGPGYCVHLLAGPCAEGPLRRRGSPPSPALRRRRRVRSSRRRRPLRSSWRRRRVRSSRRTRGPGAAGLSSYSRTLVTRELS